MEVAVPSPGLKLSRKAKKSTTPAGFIDKERILATDRQLRIVRKEKQTNFQSGASTTRERSTGHIGNLNTVRLRPLDNIPLGGSISLKRKLEKSSSTPYQLSRKSSQAKLAPLDSLKKTLSMMGKDDDGHPSGIASPRLANLRKLETHRLSMHNRTRSVASIRLEEQGNAEDKHQAMLDRLPRNFKKGTFSPYKSISRLNSREDLLVNDGSKEQISTDLDPGTEMFERMNPKDAEEYKTIRDISEMESRIEESEDDLKESVLVTPSKPLLTEEERVTKWGQITTLLLNTFDPIDIGTTDAFKRLVRNKRSLKRTVRVLESRFASKQKRRGEAATKIQANYRSHFASKRFGAQKAAVLKIQKHARRVQAQSSYKLTISSVVRIQFLWRRYVRRRERRIQSVATIQRATRCWLAYKTFHPLIVKAVKRRKHEEFMLRQAQKVNERKKQKESVQTISDFWLSYLARQEARRVRKILAKVPFECRLLWLKLKAVKQDADELRENLKDLIKKEKAEGRQDSEFGAESVRAA